MSSDKRGSVHELKCWPEFFVPLLSGDKTFELRKGDRFFRVGDELLIREWSPGGGGYTGREERRTITYTLSGLPWLAPGYVALGLSAPSANQRTFEEWWISASFDTMDPKTMAQRGWDAALKNAVEKK